MASQRRPVLILVMAAAVAAVLVGVLGGSSPGGDDATADRPAAPDVAFETFDGQSVALSDFEGRPVVLNFWASWCPACVAEMPDFEAVHQRLGDQVTFIGMDMQDISRQDALALVEQTGVTYLLADDPDGAIYQTFGGVAMPTTVFIDADGRVAEVHGGALFADDLEQMIRNLLLET